MAYSSIDYKISGGSDLTQGNSVSGYQGIYVKERPYQVIAAFELVKLSVAGAILGVEEAIAIAGELGRRLAADPQVLR